MVQDRPTKCFSHAPGSNGSSSLCDSVMHNHLAKVQETCAKLTWKPHPSVHDKIWEWPAFHVIKKANSSSMLLKRPHNINSTVRLFVCNAYKLVFVGCNQKDRTKCKHLAKYFLIPLSSTLRNVTPNATLQHIRLLKITEAQHSSPIPADDRFL